MATNKEIIQVKVKGAQKAKNGLKGIGAAALKMGAIFFAAKGVINGIKGSIDAFGEQELAMKKIQTVLKSTNNASGITADGFYEMAASLQQVTTFGDEAIMGAQSLMMTFTKVGKEVMPDAIETVLNMSEAMNVGLKEQTIQLGKALNDPIQGISALSRVGVQLSDEQKLQIKSFMAVNDIAGAQAVILGELETQFGGMAKAAKDTLPGAIKSMKNALGDLGEEVGGLLAPAIQAGADLITGIAEKAGEGMDFAKTIDWSKTFENISNNTQIIWDAFAETARLGMDILPDLVGDFFPKMFNMTVKALGWIVDAIISIAKDLWKPIGNAFETLIFDIKAGWERFKVSTGQIFDIFAANTKNHFIGIGRTIIQVINDAATASNKILGTEFDMIKLPDLIDMDGLVEKQKTVFDKLTEDQKIAREKMISEQESSEIIDFLTSLLMGTEDEDSMDTIEQFNSAVKEIWVKAGNDIIEVSDEVKNKTESNNDDINKSNEKSARTFQKLTAGQKELSKSGAAQLISDLEKVASANEKYKKIYKAAAITQTIASTYESAQEQFNKFSEAYPAPFGQILGVVAATAAVGAGLARVAEIKKAQYGANFVTSGPQMMMVGEGSGPERVQVTPLVDPNLDGPQGQGITLNISGNVLHESFIEDDVIPQIREGLRLGENMGI